MGFKPEEIAAAASKVISKLTASGQIGGGKAVPPITFDGYVDGLQTIPIDEIGAMYRISDALPTMPEPNRLVLTTVANDEAVYTHDQLIVGEEAGMTTIVAVDTDGHSLALATNILDSPEAEAMGIASGLYVYGWTVTTTIDGRERAGAWLASIEFVGEIKPIDPKYLPSDVLPRVELSEETATTLLGAGVATLNAAEAVMLDEMASNATPFLICAKMQGMTLVNGLMQYVLTTSTYMPGYVGALPYISIHGGGENESPAGAFFDIYNMLKRTDGWKIYRYQTNAIT